MFISISRNVKAVRVVIIEDSKCGSIPDKTETPGLLDEGSQQYGICHYQRVTYESSHSQRHLASLEMHRIKWTEESIEEEHKQGKYGNFLKKSDPLLL